MPLSALLLKLITGEPLTRAEGYEVARLVLQLLRERGGS